MTEERRYTLAEAREIIADQECAKRGHEYGISNGSAGQPAGLYCARCGSAWYAVPRSPGLFAGSAHEMENLSAIPPQRGWVIQILDKNGSPVGDAGPIHPTREAAEQWMKEATT